MRNAGEGTPVGGTGRRQRTAAPTTTARPTGNAGASLFTPAYRVRHATAPESPTRTATRGGSDYGVTSTSYSWATEDQDVPGYQETEYEAGSPSADWADSDRPVSGYSWMTDLGDSGSWPVGGLTAASASRGPRSAIRGFPPAPDEPLPTYPPGPFAAWNRSADRGEQSPASRAELNRPQAPLAAATITPDEFDTDYSIPAIKDPAPAGGSDKSRSSRSRASQSGASQSRASQSRASQSRASQSGTSQSGAGRLAPGRSPSGVAERTSAPADGGGAGGRRHGKPTRAGGARPKSKHRSAWLAIGVAALIVVAVIVVLVATSTGSTPPTTAKTTAPSRSASPAPTTPAGKWEYIGSRATDPIPLGLRELFPASFTTAGAYYHLTIESRAHDCHTALIGGALQAAVRAGDCTQDLRASYVSRLKGAMATIGVFNLATAAGASAAAQHTGPSQFVDQLPAKNGVSSKLGQGTGLEEALVKGHYLVLVWAENINLSTPKTAWQRNHLTIFMNTLIAETINSSLSNRMVDGKPATSA
jgi:hypothetical protein